MAWSYICDACGMRIAAENKEQLTDKVMRHANEAHNMGLTRDETRQSVEQKAREQAQAA